MVDLEERVKLRVLKDRLEQLSGVIVPTCLNQLQQQGQNIKKYQEEEEWEPLKREQRNVSNTIRQLRTHVQELDDVKSQVSIEDQYELCQEIRPIQERILDSITDFKHLDPTVPLIDESNQEDDDYLTISKGGTSEVACQVWNELHNELEELQGLNTALLEHVQDQSEAVHRVELQVNEAEERVHSSMITIEQMVRIKAMMLPVGGAVLGGVVGGVMGGPIGLYAGAKIGTLFAVAGGTAGAVGGGLLGYKRGQNIKETFEDITPKKDQ